MLEEFFLEYLKLKNARETFATAMVVQHGTPISGKTGDKAIIRADGSIHGWIGGGCTHPIVIEEALALMNSGHSRLINIDPQTKSVEGVEVKHFQMTCHSGGSLSVYIEPVFPKPLVVVFGDSPVGQNLLKLSANLDYETLWLTETRFAETNEEGKRVSRGFDLKSFNLEDPTFLVVCTQGEGDLDALRAAFSRSVSYRAFVGSLKKMEALKNELAEEGVCSGKLSQLHNPAGININARTPSEIALSILAEIVLTLRAEPTKSVENPVDVQKAVDPVCGMEVRVENARYVSVLESQNHYFCCSGCKTKFEKAPQTFLVAG